VQEVCKEYALRRKQFKKSKLRWRVSDPQKSKYSLGWIPFKGPSIRYHNGQLAFAGHRFSLWDSYGLSKYTLKAGNIFESILNTKHPDIATYYNNISLLYKDLGEFQKALDYQKKCIYHLILLPNSHF
jgi:tetratricopeptide (TPR) repeat protein